MQDSERNRVESALGSLDANGYAVWHGWVADPAVAELRRETVQVLETCRREDYAYGRMVKLRPDELGDRARRARGLLFDGPIDAVCRAYGARAERDRLCWTEETEPDAGRGPGRPHVGPARHLKVIVYLTDVLSDSGPFRILPTDRNTAEQRWLATWRHLLGLGDDVAEVEVYRRAADYSAARDDGMLDTDAPPIDAIAASALHPVIGLAGSVVFFDTQVLHCGGSIEPGGYRLTARRHCEMPLS